uniref:fasciclin-like arabinogalactan protein 10 n=1 Tax=Erigeron canadensis TaxID=72917 RepID=UPI001CB932FE|nr:fasciclin-like arabinogalactan protein 10 [Erigeron canadensis]
MNTLQYIIITITLSVIATVSSGFNITDMLSRFPQYSMYNNYLTQTKLCDDINIRNTITVLVFDDTTMKTLVANQPLPVVKTLLGIHVLLDYFDYDKLLDISEGTVKSTTLYQTTGNAVGETGYVNITDLVGGQIGFASAQGSKLVSLYTRSVMKMPYNISIVEVNSPIIPPGILGANTTSPSSNVNITSVFENAGCKTFARLVVESGVLKVYETAQPNGLTVFAPTDSAFKAHGLPNLNNVTNSDLISLLLFHGISSYIPKASLKMEHGPVNTLATHGDLLYNFTVQTNGDSVTIDSGVDITRLETMVLDSIPVSVFRIDNILLPKLLFHKSRVSAPAPAPAPESSTASGPIASSPAPEADTSPEDSPPAPPATSVSSSPSSGLAPADGPAADMGTSNASEAYKGNKASMLLVALVTLSFSGIMSFIVA